uniref:Uncharacterized protein n=1 Tax=Arundo donax TaxID=35708 RepID=A0A0A9B5L3_ARUDO
MPNGINQLQTYRKATVRSCVIQGIPVIIQCNLMAVSKHLHTPRNYATDYSCVERYAVFPLASSSNLLYNHHIRGYRQKKNGTTLFYNALTNNSQPQNSLNKHRGQCHLISIHQFQTGKLTKTARHFSLLGSKPLAASTARVGFPQKARDPTNH